MGPTVWYWSERLMRSNNHAEPTWPAGNSSWRYVGVTHEAYVHPERTMSGSLFINYVGDTDPARAIGMPAAVAGQFYISHDADDAAESKQRRWLRDVQLLERFMDKPD